MLEIRALVVAARRRGGDEAVEEVLSELLAEVAAAGFVEIGPGRMHRLLEIQMTSLKVIDAAEHAPQWAH